MKNKYFFIIFTLIINFTLASDINASDEFDFNLSKLKGGDFFMM